MGTKGKQFYTLPGLGGVFENYSEADKAKKGKEYSDYQYPVAFASSESASAFEAGNWRDYLSKNIETNVGEYEAVIYTDGSFNDKDKDGGEDYASYGLVIFTKEGDVICEVAKLKDIESKDTELGVIQRDINYSIHLRNLNGGYGKSDENASERVEKETINYEIVKDNSGFVEASRNVAGEMMGALRGLEICFSELGLSKVMVVCDCDAVSLRSNKGIDDVDSNVAYHFGKYCQDNILDSGRDVKFMEVTSHGLLDVKDPGFMHAVYNDMCDALAKSVCHNHVVKQADNPNLRVAIAEYTDKFNISKSGSIETRRDQAITLLNELLKINDIRPKFL